MTVFCHGQRQLWRADKSTFKGFAPFREEPGLLIAYATEPGNVAVDENLYARALAEEIVKQGSEAGSAFRAVSRRVYEATGQRQRPEYNDRRFDDFVFKPALPSVALETFPERPVERQRGLQEARQQEKQAQDALKGAGDAKKAAVDISSLAPPSNKFDGAWRIIYLSEECSNRRREFIVTIKNGVGTTGVGAAKTYSNGDFTYSGKNSEGAIFSYVGKIADKSGGGKVISSRPEQGFSCSGTFTMTKLH